MLLLLALAAQVPDTIQLRPGLVITRSAVVRAGHYRLTPLPGDSVVVRVTGTDIVLDLRGAELSGAPADADPDRRAGIGILVQGGSEVTIRGGRINGYHVALLARGVQNLVVEQVDVSRNRAPRLWSGPGHESLVDWLYFHQNEREEWLRYGAGIYLADVRGGTIRGNTARHGMNGLLLVRSDSLRIAGNDFSYLSGLGIGLYRSSHNTILQNRLDWCVRGYVHGVYRRGQDSAALLLYEQSSHNVVAYNSMTHSGDGVFLWAGQSTMDSGAGGANDNLFFGNDVSYAVANGVEATFSRNRIIGNLAMGSEYGVWGGYSWETVIRGNRFEENVTGIAIEHGQDNEIAGNTFRGERTAIRLWANPSQPGDWGYPRHRDTRSRDYVIEGNRFDTHRVAVRVNRTSGVRLEQNAWQAVDTALALDSLSGVDRREDQPPGPGPTGPWEPDFSDPEAPAPDTTVGFPWLPDAGPRGREHILVDEWGPFDRLAPRLWPADVADSGRAGGARTWRVVGPPGRWQVVGRRGVARVSADSGAVGDLVRVTPESGSVTDWSLDLEYVGGAVVDRQGREVAANAPYRFTADDFAAPIPWHIQTFTWDSTSDPRRDPGAFRRLLASEPQFQLTTNRLDWMWYRPALPGLPQAQWALTASGEVDLPPGAYDLVAISDDGIRVWVDDRLVVDNWSPHESVVDRVPLRGGRHRLRVAYYQVGGWVECRVEVVKRRE